MSVPNILWICGRVPNEGSWELCGIYSTRELAEARCVDSRHFVTFENLDVDMPYETEHFPNIYWPRLINSHSMKVTTTQLAAMGYGPDGSKLTPANASKSCAREAELHRQILDYCRAKGWPVVHSRMDVPQTCGVGTPDFVVALPDGRTLWVECKAGAGKLSSEQRAWMAGLVRLGHDAHVVRSMSEFLEVLR